ncbi:hypothetical protein Bca4012_084401 [Brassica carinata]
MVRILLRMRCRDLRQIVMCEIPFHRNVAVQTAANDTGFAYSSSFLHLHQIRIHIPSAFWDFQATNPTLTADTHVEATNSMLLFSAMEAPKSEVEHHLPVLHSCASIPEIVKALFQSSAWAAEEYGILFDLMCSS